MTRIIGGAFGGRTIGTPRGPGTRPTSDRVREALFSTLVSRDASRGRSVLDLYAGSGALGLEAMSRGASSVTFVESDRRAAAVIGANVKTLRVAHARTVPSTVAAFLARPADAAYGLVFVDPPYPLGEEDLSGVLHRLAHGGWLAADALVVVERSRRAPEPRWPLGLVVEDHRAYGETTLWYAGPDDSEE